MVRVRSALGWTALGGAIGAALMFAIAPRDLLKDADDEHAAAPAENQSDLGAGKVRLEAAAQRRIALATVSLPSTTSRQVQEGFLKGLDAAPLAAIEADIGSARASLAASQAQAQRQATLYRQDQSASLESVQTSKAQARGDAARLALATNRIGLEYGPGLAALPDAGRVALLAQIADGRAALVRIDVPGATLYRSAHVELAEGAGSLQLLGPAAATEAKLQSAGILAILRGPAATSAAAGRTLPVRIAGSGTASGVLVPADAVVRWREGLWVYKPLSSELFARTELMGARPVDGGWFVAQGLKPGERIVARGAGTLLGIEHGGAPVDED